MFYLRDLLYDVLRNLYVLEIRVSRTRESEYGVTGLKSNACSKAILTPVFKALELAECPGCTSAAARASTKLFDICFFLSCSACSITLLIS